MIMKNILIKDFHYANIRGIVISFLPLPFWVVINVNRLVRFFPRFTLKPSSVRIDNNDRHYTPIRYWYSYRRIHWLCFLVDFGIITKTDY